MSSNNRPVNVPSSHEKKAARNRAYHCNRRESARNNTTQDKCFAKAKEIVYAADFNEELPDNLLSVLKTFKACGDNLVRLKTSLVGSGTFGAVGSQEGIRSTSGARAGTYSSAGGHSGGRPVTRTMTPTSPTGDQISTPQGEEVVCVVPINWQLLETGVLQSEAQAQLNLPMDTVYILNFVDELELPPQ